MQVLNKEIENTIIYNYTAGEVREILLYQGVPRPIFPTKHPERSEGCFVDKIGLGNSWSSKIFKCPKKQLYRILSSFEMKMRDVFSENFAEREVILHKCTNGREATY